jgi:hypothetical protein
VVEQPFHPGASMSRARSSERICNSYLLAAPNREIGLVGEQQRGNRSRSPDKSFLKEESAITTMIPHFSP